MRGGSSIRVGMAFMAMLALPAALGKAETPPAGPPLSAATEYVFGKRFDSGDGVPQNFVYAAYWYRRAAAHGDPRAQLALAAHYVAGIGVDQDLVSGNAWANIAAADLPKGSPDWESAVAYRKITMFRLSPWQLERAQQLSYTLYPGFLAGDAGPLR